MWHRLSSLGSRIHKWSPNRLILASVFALASCSVADFLPNFYAPVRAEGARYCHHKSFHLCVLSQVFNQPSNCPFISALALLRHFHCKLHLSLRHVLTNMFQCSIGSPIPVLPPA